MDLCPHRLLSNDGPRLPFFPLLFLGTMVAGVVGLADASVSLLSVLPHRFSFLFPMLNEGDTSSLKLDRRRSLSGRGRPDDAFYDLDPLSPVRPHSRAERVPLPMKATWRKLHTALDDWNSFDAFFFL